MCEIYSHCLTRVPLAHFYRFFNDTATTEIYTLSLHDALPISTIECCMPNQYADQIEWFGRHIQRRDSVLISVHTHNDQSTGDRKSTRSELQSRPHLVCRLLLEKKNLNTALTQH